MADIIDDVDDEGARCGGCGDLLKEGDLVHADRDGGAIHADCCGDDPESFFDADDKPLKPGDPIPAPWSWSADLPAIPNGARGTEGEA